jgi:hypothetical protein
MPHPLFETVRERFRYACGYCGVTEITVGGGLTLDHYRPQAAGGDDSLDNLVYACIRCNQYKGDIALLRLNRPQLVSHRLARHLQVILREKVRLLEQQNAELEKTIAAQERYLGLLRSRPTRGG